MHPQIAVRILPFEKKLADALNQLVENGSLAADLKPYQLVSDRHEGLPTMLCVCQSTREVVGGASFVMPEYEAQKVIEILTLYVDQGHRRQGIAESMIRRSGPTQNRIASRICMVSQTHGSPEHLNSTATAALPWSSRERTWSSERH